MRLRPHRRAAMGLLAGGALGAGLAPLPAREPRQAKPRVPVAPHPGGVPVAIVGAGLDYTRPAIAARLARDGEGDLIGFDAIDGDHLPLERADGVTSAPPDAGTGIALVVLDEAGAACLVPVRVPAGDPRRALQGLGFVARTPARVALVLGAWPAEAVAAFLAGARATGRLLVVVPAGFRAEAPGAVAAGPAPAIARWPDLPDNVVVVTACDGVGSIPDGVGHGRDRVDIAVPVGPWEGVAAVGTAAENIAAARIAALAARIAATAPAAAGDELARRLLAHATAHAPDAPRATRAGWIRDVARTAQPR